MSSLDLHFCEARIGPRKCGLTATHHHPRNGYLCPSHAMQLPGHRGAATRIAPNPEPHKSTKSRKKKEH